DVGLQIGEVQHQVGLERQNLRHVGRDEGGDARLFLAHLGGAHRIAGHADDALGRKHAGSLYSKCGTCSSLAAWERMCEEAPPRRARWRTSPATFKYS